MNAYIKYTYITIVSNKRARIKKDLRKNRRPLKT